MPDQDSSASTSASDAQRPRVEVDLPPFVPPRADRPIVEHDVGMEKARPRPAVGAAHPHADLPRAATLHDEGFFGPRVVARGDCVAWPGQREGEEHHARSATIAASTTRMPTRNVPKLRHADVSELPFLRSHSRQMAQVFTPPSVSVQQLPHTERRHEAQGPAASREQNAQRSGPSSPECWS